MRFPYIPTFLAFRELEGLLKAIDGLDADIFMVGAHGVAHPRRAGLACHLGVIIERPTFGVAKNSLCGIADEPPNAAGAHSPLIEGGETIGAALRTIPGSRPVYVSVGHMVSLELALRVAMDTIKGHRLPEPLRVAHEIATEAARSKAYR